MNEKWAEMHDVEIDTVTNCEVLNPPRTTPSV